MFIRGGIFRFSCPNCNSLPASCAGRSQVFFASMPPSDSYTVDRRSQSDARNRPPTAKRSQLKASRNLGRLSMFISFI